MGLKSNKRLGNDFEKEFANILSEMGYWVTMLTPKTHIGSQPADLIAIKNNKPILVDCKTCDSCLFPLSRIEENQIQASKKYFKCGNTGYYIVIKYKKDIYTIPIDTIDFTQKSINLRTQTKWRLRNENNSC